MNPDAQQLLPVAPEVLEQILDALPVVNIGRLQQASSLIRAAAKERRPWVLHRRRLDACWSWRKAHAAETALFFDMRGSPGLWTPGPNDKHGNVIESCKDDDVAGVVGTDASWLWLSGGTDWQGFQGGFRCISECGIQPTWLTFNVRIATPALSGAFLTFSAAQRTWGLEDIVMAFHYSGDERLSQRRCFVVQTGAAQHGDMSHPILELPEIVADRPYQIAMNFDWAAGVMSVFIDGVRYVHLLPFKAAHPVRFSAIYNWRSGARTAFSELMVGHCCPYAIRSNEVKSRLSARCKHRSSPSCTLSSAVGSSATVSTGKSLTLTGLLFGSAAFGFLVAVLAQQLLAASQ